MTQVRIEINPSIASDSGLSDLVFHMNSPAQEVFPTFRMGRSSFMVLEDLIIYPPDAVRTVAWPMWAESSDRFQMIEHSKINQVMTANLLYPPNATPELQAIQRNLHAGEWHPLTNPGNMSEEDFKIMFPQYSRKRKDRQPLTDMWTLSKQGWVSETLRNTSPIRLVKATHQSIDRAYLCKRDNKFRLLINLNQSLDDLVIFAKSDHMVDEEDDWTSRSSDSIRTAFAA